MEGDKTLLLLARIAVLVLSELWIARTLLSGFQSGTIYVGRKGFSGGRQYAERSEQPIKFWYHACVNIFGMILAPVILFVI